MSIENLKNSILESAARKATASKPFFPGEVATADEIADLAHRVGRRVYCNNHGRCYFPDKDGTFQGPYNYGEAADLCAVAIMDR